MTSVGGTGSSRPIVGYSPVSKCLQARWWTSCWPRCFGIRIGVLICFLIHYFDQVSCVVKSKWPPCRVATAIIVCVFLWKDVKSSPSCYVKYLHLHQPTAQNHVYKQLLTFFLFFFPLCKFFTCGCISWCGFQSARCHHHCLSATASLQPTSSQVARSNFRFKVSLRLLRRGINMEKSSFPPTAHTLQCSDRHSDV